MDECCPVDRFVNVLRGKLLCTLVSIMYIGTGPSSTTRIRSYSSSLSAKADEAVAIIHTID